jgi:hypothetical protein
MLAEYPLSAPPWQLNFERNSKLKSEQQTAGRGADMRPSDWSSPYRPVPDRR